MHRNLWRQQLRDYTEFLQTNYSLDSKDIRNEILAAQIPAGIYDCENTPLQTTALYLQSTQEYTFTQLAETLGRTIAEIKQTLSKATTAIGPLNGPKISTAAFADRTLSVGEHLVAELEEQNLTVDEIASVLGKNSQTIYTIRRRIRQKRGEANE